jgi:hypothetical protein
MIRKLIWEEFVRNLTKGVLASTAVVLFFSVFIRLLRWLGPGPAETNDVAIGIGTLIALSGAAGASAEALSRTFRKGAFALLDVMPISRATVWTVRVSQALIGSLFMTLAIALVDPVVRDGMLQGKGFNFVTVWLLLFTLGTCLSAILSSTPLITIVLTAGVTLLVNFMFFTIERYLMVDIFISGPTGFAASASTMFLLAPTCLLLSFVIFMRGEMDIPRRRTRNLGLVAGVLLVEILGCLIAVDAGVFEVGAPWKDSNVIAASPDRTFFSAVQFRGPSSPGFRIAIIESATGNVVRTYEGRSFAGHVWNPDNSLVVFTKGSALRYVLTGGSDSLNATRVFPQEQFLFHRTGDQLEGALDDSRGALVLLQKSTPRSSTEHSLERIDKSGELRHLLDLPRNGPDSYFLTNRYNGSTVSSNGRLWRIRDDAVEMKISSGNLRLATQEDMIRALNNLRKGVPAGGGPGRYVLTPIEMDAADSSWGYYLQAQASSQTASLWARRNSNSTWKEVVHEIPLTDTQAASLTEKDSANLFTKGGFPELQPFSRAGVVVLLRGGDAMLYDVSTDERFDLKLPASNATPSGIDVVKESDSEVAVRFYALKENKVSYLPVAFLYRPGKGKPLRFDAPPRHFSPTLFGATGTALNVGGSYEEGWDFLFAKDSASPKSLVIP